MEFSTVLNQDLLAFQMPDFTPQGLFFKLGLATILGIFMSVVVKVTSTENKKKKRTQRALMDMQHTHILICVAGSFIMIIIGNSLANAFGLTGALSMIRFRTNLIEPKDAAVIILIISIGMACGLELFLTAVFMCGLSSLLLMGMYFQGARLRRRHEDDEDGEDPEPTKAV